MKLGERLKGYRKNAGLTLAELKEKTNLSVSYLSDLERGRTNPSLETLKQIAGVYQTTVSALVEGIEGWGEQEIDDIPRGLMELKNDATFGNQITNDDLRALSKISLRGKQPQTKEEWLAIYLHLTQMLRSEDR
jgi:transcriptional regulator with XRE-family HTH domain